MVMIDTLRRLAARDATIEELSAAAEEGMRGPGDDGLEKVAAGHTTIEELRRILI